MTLAPVLAAAATARRGLDALRPLVLLGARLAVAWPFFKAGLVKIQDFETTRFLFQEEYHVPLLPPDVAAVAGTAGELVFPVLLALGLGTRLAAAGLGAVNVMAVVAYAHVLLEPGFEAALGQHWLWGFMLLVLLVFGPGGLSLDALLGRFRARPAVAAASRV